MVMVGLRTPPFDADDIGAIDAVHVGKILLAEAGFFTEAPNIDCQSLPNVHRSA